jgi:bifunctional enzyme CysN/CysC
MPVQDVYKFTKQGDDRRIIAGTVETGTLRVGDEVVFYPSGKRSRVKSIESFNTPVRQEAEAGQAAGFHCRNRSTLRGVSWPQCDRAQPKVTPFREPLLAR